MLRRFGLVLVGLVSVGLSLILMWWQVTPESIGSVATVQLLVTLALAALPMLTYAAWRFDFTTSKEGDSGVRSRRSPHDAGREHPVEPGDRSSRSGRRHRRNPGPRNSGDLPSGWVRD